MVHIMLEKRKNIINTHCNYYLKLAFLRNILNNALKFISCLSKIKYIADSKMVLLLHKCLFTVTFLTID